MSTNLENSAVATGWEISVFIPIPKKGNAKECSNYCTIVLISHVRKSENENESCSVVSDSLWPHGLYSPSNYPGHDTGVGSHSLLQGIFPTQGSNPGLPHYRKILYQLNHQRSSNASKIMFKIFQARFQQCVNWTLPNVQTRFRKGNGTRDQIANIHCIIEKAREFQKYSLKAFDCVDQYKLWEILKEMGISGHITWLLRNLCTGQEATFKTRHGTMDWFKTEKKYIKAVYCHCTYLTYMQRTSCEMLDWINHRLKSRLLGEISTTSSMNIIPF